MSQPSNFAPNTGQSMSSYAQIPEARQQFSCNSNNFSQPMNGCTPVPEAQPQFSRNGNISCDFVNSTCLPRQGNNTPPIHGQQYTATQTSNASSRQHISAQSALKDVSNKAVFGTFIGLFRRFEITYYYALSTCSDEANFAQNTGQSMNGFMNVCTSVPEAQQQFF